jgi:hypothetical protein
MPIVDYGVKYRLPSCELHARCRSKTLVSASTSATAKMGMIAVAMVMDKAAGDIVPVGARYTTFCTAASGLSLSVTCHTLRVYILNNLWLSSAILAMYLT